MNIEKLKQNDVTLEVSYQRGPENSIEAHLDESRQYLLLITQSSEGMLFVECNGKRHRAYVHREDDQIHVWLDGRTLIFEDVESKAASGSDHFGAGQSNSIETPMPGKILKLMVKSGDSIKKGDQLFIVEAMKMENEVLASRDGVVKAVHFSENDLVSVGEAVVELESLIPADAPSE